MSAWLQISIDSRLTQGKCLVLLQFQNYLGCIQNLDVSKLVWTGQKDSGPGHKTTIHTWILHIEPSSKLLVLSKTIKDRSKICLDLLIQISKHRSLLGSQEHSTGMPEGGGGMALLTLTNRTLTAGLFKSKSLCFGAIWAALFRRPC